MNKSSLFEVTNKVHNTIQEQKEVYKKNIELLRNTIFKNSEANRWIKLEMTGLCKVIKLEIKPSLLKKDIETINEKLTLAIGDVFNQITRNYSELSIDVLNETFGDDLEKYGYR